MSERTDFYQWTKEVELAMLIDAWKADTADVAKCDRVDMVKDTRDLLEGFGSPWQRIMRHSIDALDIVANCKSTDNPKGTD